MSETGQLPDTTLDARTFATANDLPAETRDAVVQRLNRSLADATDLMTQLKFAHWNVKGINFYQLHLLFDEVAEELQEHVDMLAERATTLGGQAMGTVRMAAATSRIPEMSPHVVTGPKYVEEVVEHLAVHATNLRDDIDFAAEVGDEDTADLYTELSREIDHQLYFLESHLQTEFAGTAAQGSREAPGVGREESGRGAPSGRGRRQAPPRTRRETFEAGRQPRSGGGREPPSNGPRDAGERRTGRQ